MLDGNGALISRFVYGSRSNAPDMLVLADGSLFRIISDQLGSPRVVARVRSGANGAAEATIVRKIDYDEFGNPTVTFDAGVISDRALPIGFAGGLYDPDTGFVHFGARDYDPSVGRWTAKDPILFKARQSNLYVYSANDPVNSTDPTGLYGMFNINGGDVTILDVNYGKSETIFDGMIGAPSGKIAGDGVGVAIPPQFGASYGSYFGFFTGNGKDLAASGGMTISAGEFFFVGLKIIFGPDGTWGVGVGAGFEVGTAPGAFSIDDLYSSGEFVPWPKPNRRRVCE